LLKTALNYNCAVIKNVKHHRVDKEGKDSYKFIEAGAFYSVIQNINGGTAIFFKEKNNELENIINWLEKGLYEIDVILTEGFRNVNNPTVLCVANYQEIEEQLNNNVKLITGLLFLEERNKKSIHNIPIINIETDFKQFLEIFSFN